MISLFISPDPVLLIALFLIVTIGILYFIPDKKKMEEKKKYKQMLNCRGIDSGEETIEYFMKEIMEIYREADNRKIDGLIGKTHGSMYTDDELDRIRLYAYAIYKTSIHISDLTYKLDEKTIKERTIKNANGN